MSDSIDIRVGADSRPLQTGLQRARQSVREFAQRAQSDMGTAAGAVGVGLSVGAVISFASEMMDLAGNLQDMSDKLGVGVVTLQELQFAFGQGGASAEDIDKAITKLSENTMKALGGNKEMIASFERLGVSLDDLRRMSPDEVIMAIGASAQDSQDPAQRLSDILDTLGKSGGKMAPMLNAGTEAINEMREAALTLSATDVAMLDDAGDKIANEITRGKVALTKFYLWSEEQFQKAMAFADKLGGHQVAKAVEATADPDAQRKAREASARKAEEEEKAKDLQEFNEMASELYNERLRDEYKANQEHQARQRQITEDRIKGELEYFIESENAKIRKREESEKHQERMEEEAQQADRDKTDRSNQIRENAKALEEKEANEFIQGELAGPAARREAKRQEAREERARNKFGRLERLKERGGKAEADVLDRPDVNRMERPQKEELIPKSFVSDINTLQRTLTAFAGKIGVAQ